MKITDKAFDYAMQRGHGRKSYEHYIAGVKGVLSEINEAYEIGGIEATIDRLNSLSDEFK